MPIGRPAPSEYDPFYAGYIARITDEPIAGLESQTRATRAVWDRVTDHTASHRYAEGKWTVRDMLNHVIDVERIMAYRALRIARGDATPLPGFEQDDYVRVARADRRAWTDLVAEWSAGRAATLALFRGFDDEAWNRRGFANGAPITVRALGYIIPGHENHHVEILRTRYNVT